MLVKDYWLLHILRAGLSLFSSCFQHASGTDKEPLSISRITIKNDNSDLVSKRTAKKQIK